MHKGTHIYQSHEIILILTIRSFSYVQSQKTSNFKYHTALLLTKKCSRKSHSQALPFRIWLREAVEKWLEWMASKGCGELCKKVKFVPWLSLWLWACLLICLSASLSTNHRPALTTSFHGKTLIHLYWVYQRFGLNR